MSTASASSESATASMVPPPEMDFVGGTQFEAIGKLFLKQFIKPGGLKPHHRVLEVGCGIGRMAVPLTQYLDEEGSYDGFDIREDGIQWCQERITPRYPRFRFKLAKLHNSHYLPEEKTDASNFHFPYPSRSFDFVILTSVFTHLQPDVVCNYLDEINRVLRPDGRMFATFFLFADGAPPPKERVAQNLHFAHDHEYFRLWQAENPGAAIAYDESWVVAQCERRGLQIRWPVKRGFQDIVVAQKKQGLPLRHRWRRWRARLRAIQ
ncbi:MAG TPA: class I SAM-dependent methyltransferase [Candidatus Saccharimonadia bacterium]|nr:class I SAM-dependent methyltransferase [Candidatus Saccharimonadia bacterium]